VLEAEYGSRLLRLGNMFKGAGGIAPEVMLRLGTKEIPPATELITGHLPFAAVDFISEETRNFTLLRDPAERTISHYFFLADHRDRLARGERAKTSEVLRVSTDLKSALASDTYFPDNLQTRMLADDPGVGGPCTESMLKQAKRNLSTKFEVFGLVERFDESLALCWQSFGWRAPLYRVRARTTANRPRAADLTSSERSAIETTTRFDRELYDYAAKLFSRRISAQDEWFRLELSAMQAAQRLIEQGEWPARGRPEPGDVFSYRVHQLCAEFELLEERERARGLKDRLAKAHEVAAELRLRNERLGAKAAGRKEGVPRPAPAPEEGSVPPDLNEVSQRFG